MQCNDLYVKKKIKGMKLTQKKKKTKIHIRATLMWATVRFPESISQIYLFSKSISRIPISRIGPFPETYNIPNAIIPNPDFQSVRFPELSNVY